MNTMIFLMLLASFAAASKELTQCLQSCSSKPNHGYKDSCNQILSCDQACRVRHSGLGKEQCLDHCAEIDCKQEIAGELYYKCGPCHGGRNLQEYCEQGCNSYPEEVYMMETGRCPTGYSYLSSLAECNAAAQMLGLPDVVADYVTGSTTGSTDAFPYGCYFKQSARRLYYNTDDRNKNSGDTDRLSLCNYNAGPLWTKEQKYPDERCLDMTGWTDQYGNDCMYYYTYEFGELCEDGIWRHSYLYPNPDAGDACCGCGGGSWRTVYRWTDSSGMLGWKATSQNGNTYKNAFINDNTYGMTPYPYNQRDASHDPLVVVSPSFCKPHTITFMLQGGVSPTKDTWSDDYLGVVLIKNGVTIKQAEMEVNIHEFKRVTWNLERGTRDYRDDAWYRIELRDGKTINWAHLELQEVVIDAGNCAEFTLDSKNLLKFGDGYVCGGSNYFNEKSATMVCTTFGKYLTSYKKGQHIGTDDYTIDNLSCPEGATSLAECAWSTSGRNCNNSNKGIELICSNEPPTERPTKSPTRNPTNKPTAVPTKNPTERPTKSPTRNPTYKPTAIPTKNPTEIPTKSPTRNPTEKPTPSPTRVPTTSPTEIPTVQPTEKPSPSPTRVPTTSPTEKPSPSPTTVPTTSPTEKPSPSPTTVPTTSPTEIPTESPTETKQNSECGKTKAYESVRSKREPTCGMDYFIGDGCEDLSSKCKAPHCEAQCTANPKCNYYYLMRSTDQCLMFSQCVGETPTDGDFRTMHKLCGGSPYEECMEEARTHIEGAAKRPAFEKGCELARDLRDEELCLESCAAFSGAPVDCCKCNGECQQCDCAYCTSFCEKYAGAFGERRRLTDRLLGL